MAKILGRLRHSLVSPRLALVPRRHVSPVPQESQDRGCRPQQPIVFGIRRSLERSAAEIPERSLRKPTYGPHV
jgi:hypothetical protein